jgi:hypothetical protein
MQQAHVITITALGRPRLERVVRAAEHQAREEIVAITLVGEGTWFADQRPDHVAVMDALLTAAEQPWDRQQMRRGTVQLERV